MPFICKCQQINSKTFKTQLYFDSYISYIYIYHFLLGYKKMDKKQNYCALVIIKSWSKELWSFAFTHISLSQ